jgi:ribosome-associated protein
VPLPYGGKTENRLRENMEITIRDEYIKLGQALKLAGLAENGAIAKEMITAGQVTVNGEVDLRRGRKCVPGDLIEFKGKQVKVTCL